MKWLERLRGKSASADDAPQSSIDGVELPLGLRLGGAIALDTTAFSLARDSFAFVPLDGHVIVEAYGAVDLGGGARLHRFYLAEDAFLQVNTTAGVLDGIKYFVFHETRNPATAAEFRSWVEPGSSLGAALQTVEGRNYARVWSDASAADWAPPVVFDERVYRGRPARFDYALTHYSMLYQRELAAMDRVESLLVSAEDYGPEEFCITYSIGVDVTTADIEIT